MSLLTNYDRVFEFIYNNPGSHFRKIKKELDLSIGTIQYQVNKLEKDGKIVSIRHRFYKFYFPNGVFQEHEKEILQVLNNASLRNVLLLIIERKNPSKHEITKFLNISYSSVNWHLEQLMSYDMILENRDGKVVRYSMNNNVNYVPEIIKLLKSHYKSIWNSWANRLAEIFLLLSVDEDRK
ncbi:MAG TPA: winged helix-turn-helix transcriptional regulator [Nitrososphaeraceae archaeon]